MYRRKYLEISVGTALCKGYIYNQPIQNGISYNLSHIFPLFRQIANLSISIKFTIRLRNLVWVKLKWTTHSASAAERLCDK